MGTNIYARINPPKAPADISREVIVGMDGNPIYKTKTDVHQDCFYLQALNVKKRKKETC